MPEISIIIPMYKTPRFDLRQCLDSLAAQSFTDFEVLVIDDGNEAGYEDIKEEYETNDSRFRFVRQEHSGVSNARNLGLSEAKGKYISFVDSDDYVDQSFLLEMHDAMKDADLAVCAVSEQYHPVKPGWVDIRVFLSLPSVYNGIQYINFCHNKMYKADIIKKNGIQFQSGIKLGEDAIFLVDYIKCCKALRMVREPRYHYMWRAGSAMRRYREEFWKWESQLIERYWDLFHTYPLSEFETQAMEKWLFQKLNHAIQYYYQGERDEKHRNEIFAQIFDSSLFAELKKCDLKNHKHLSKTEKKILWCWSKFGVKGVHMIDKAYKIKRRLRRK